MHCPVTEPRASIYYKYQVFRPWLPSQHGPQTRQKVVIAGTGPSGMVAALELARHGVPSLILSSELQFSQGSRAIVFTRRSMEILQQVGVADRMSESGLPWRFGNSYYQGQQVFRLEAPHDPDDRFFPMINVQQQYMEEYLHDACQASDLIEVRWGNKVTRTSQCDGYVQVCVDTPDGEYLIDTDWLIAADGGRSSIREGLGLRMEGASYEGFFVIADIRIDLPLPTERLAFFDPQWNRGNTVLMHREPHSIWRVDYQLPKGETPEQALEPATLKQRIDSQLAMIGYGDTPWELDWSSVYSARTMTLTDYVHGNVLFTVDAAHLLPIFGVRGANTGFQDSQSLAWHLALVIKGLAGPGLLGNFSAERVQAAREIIQESARSVRFMTPPAGGFDLLRNAVLSLSLSQEFVRPLYHWRTSRAHQYDHSRLNARDDDDGMFTEGPAHGAPPQNVRVGPNQFLLDHLGGGFDLLYFSDQASIPEGICQVIAQARSRGIPIRITAIGQHPEVAGADQTLDDRSGHLRQRYGVLEDGAAYLLRPDQHICARWQTLDATRLQNALDTALPQ